METKHTSGPWRVNEGLSAVVSDEPCTDIFGADDVEHYGGYLIAESVAPRNLSLIAAAPELLQALNACWVLGVDERLVPMVCAVLDKAEGK